MPITNKGKYIYPNGDIYTGYFTDGNIKLIDGISIKGFFSNNILPGQVKIKYPNGNEYKGLLLKFVNGYQEIYEGLFNIDDYITPYIKSIVSFQNYDDMNHNIPYLVGEEMYEYILKNKMV
jgi:hypothetical protein